ncbi:MAG TPA: DNA gyrase subunit A [Acidobacteriaceae bacterium]|jgi:DNA gyrase subunit A|nr:DNA gyrase subunit A [Acidobacteriaceae bacterium]
MPDDQNPQLPLGPDPNSPSATPSPNGAGGPGDPAAPGAPTGPGALQMLPINIEEEMRRSYLDYSMSVIIGRALPDARDGLKPVHRRVLYGMQEMGLQFNKKYTKSSKVVGHVMGNFHPHGDAAIYDTMVRLAQPFSLRYTLVDGQGNFGSVDGDPPAAMRYTEARMARIAGEMLADIDSDTVDFVPNYDESTTEPSVLPCRFPNLIVNGSSGIAVGMATNIPPHNLTEVLNATIALLQKEKAEIKSDLEIVLEHVKGPDFPTGGYLYGRGNLAQTYKTGRGRFIMRAKCGLEQITGGRQAIITTEIPYQVNKSTLIKKIAELVNDKVIDDISDVRDESDRDGMRIVIELKRGAQHEIVLNQLFKHTQMQESFSMIFLAVHNGQPKELGLPAAIHAFIDHRIDVVRRRTAFLLNKAREREHILLGYQIALDHLDNVIRLIRGASSRADARESLFRFFSNKPNILLRGTELKGVKLNPSKYDIDLAGGSISSQLAGNSAGTLILSYRQIDAILELQLYRLTQLSIDELLNELKLVRDNIAEYEAILASEKRLRRVIMKELEDIRDKYGDVRRTAIIDEASELTLEDLIADEQVAVTVSNTGYLKRTPISTYRQQRRGGTGRMGMKTREEDFVSQLIIDSTHAFLLCFTNTGRVYWLKVYEVPDIGAAGKGKAMASLVDLQPGEKVVTILPTRDLTEENKYILFVTRNGLVKKTPISAFQHVTTRGINAISIDKDDELITARQTNGTDVIFLATRDGMAVRFDETYKVIPAKADESADIEEILEGESKKERLKTIGLRPMGRIAAGNKGITLRKNDYVVGAAVTDSPVTRDAKRNELAKGKKLEAKLQSVQAVIEKAEKRLRSLREKARAEVVFLTDKKKVPDTPEIREARKQLDTAYDKRDELDAELGLSPCLILTVTENGYGKRTDVENYRLTSRGGSGVINMNVTAKVGKVVSIQLVDDTTEMMVISQFGKIIRIDTKSVRAAGRSTSGVRLLNLEADDKVASATVIPPEDPKTNGENGTLVQ